jgi:hypothetical protein
MRFKKVESLPIPHEVDKIKEMLRDEISGDLPNGVEEDNIHPDYVWEEYVDVKVKSGDLQLISIAYPFGTGDYYIHDRMDGSALKISRDEGNFHELKILMAEIVDELGDCRDADMSSSLQVDGTTDVKCRNCGGRYNVG